MEHFNTRFVFINEDPVTWCSFGESYVIVFFFLRNTQFYFSLRKGHRNVCVFCQLCILERKKIGFSKSDKKIGLAESLNGRKNNVGRLSLLDKLLVYTLQLSVVLCRLYTEKLEINQSHLNILAISCLLTAGNI